MAHAVRPAIGPVIAPERTVHLGVGPFGRRVAGLLAGTVGGRELEADDGLQAAFGTAPSAVVLALWRPALSLSEEADALAHRLGVPWLPVVLEPSFMQVGPLVVPGESPCYDCFNKRRLQHDAQWRGTSVLHEAYDRYPGLGPAGYLPQHARTAAGLAATTLRTPDGRAGTVLTAQLREPSVRQDRVIACHGCPRCTTPLSRRDLRALLGMPARRTSAEATIPAFPARPVPTTMEEDIHAR